MNMLDYIVVASGMISDQKCDEIVNMFKDSDEWMNAVCGPDSAYHPDVRNCNIIKIAKPADPKYASEQRVLLDKELFGIVSGAVRFYIQKFPYAASVINSDEGYDLMRYMPGQKVANHIDVGATNAARALSCSIQLNDGFIGGEWVFFGKEKVPVKKGDIVMFPSNFCFDHEVTPVTEGVRYSVLTFLGYK